MEKNIIKPRRLKKGSKIGFVCPSNYLDDSKYSFVEKAIKKINELGYQVIWGQNAKKFDKYGVSAGEPIQRAEDINSFFADNSIDAIWCVSGGYTAVEIISYLDFKIIKQNPKLFIGLSDNTVLLSAINKITGLVTIHGTDPKFGSGYFDDEYTHKELVNRLGKGLKGEIPKNSEWKAIRVGKAQGRLVGGNLSCMLNVAGTKYGYNYKDSILLIEAYGLSVKKALCLINRLKLMGVFEDIKGVVIGNIYGFDVDKKYDVNKKQIYFEDIFLDIVKEYNFPILKFYEAGHKCASTFLPIGAKVEIDVQNLSFSLIEDYLV
jgi:muramoyltetrapeptide carboxypeptidase